MSDITVEELIAERTEKAAESLMMAEAHDAAGHADVALGWRMSAEYADATADHLSRLRAKVASLKMHTEAQAAEIARLSADPWQPMETAPQDGTVFLYAQGQVWLSTYCPNDPEFDRPEDEPYWRMAHLSEDASEGYSIDLHPTHWMPLPAPPTDGEAV